MLRFVLSRDNDEENWMENFSFSRVYMCRFKSLKQLKLVGFLRLLTLVSLTQLPF